MKLKKILAAVAAAAVAVSTMAVSAFAANVIDGEADLGTSWGGTEIASDKFADVAEGDKVTVSYTITSDGDYHLVKFTANLAGWGDLECSQQAVCNVDDPEFKHQDPDFMVVSIDGSVTYTLTAKDAENLKTAGGVLQGYSTKVTSVDVESGAAPAAEAEAAPAAEAATYDYSAVIGFSDTSWSHQDWETSVKVTGNGQFTVESTSVAGAQDFGVFVIDLNGMYADHPEATAVLDKIEIDGAEVAFDADKIIYGDIEEKGNYRIEIYNQYGDTKGNPGVDASTAITSSLKLTFTVSGLDAAAAPAAVEETTAPVEEAPEAEEAVDEDVDEDIDVDVEEEEPEAEPVAETEAPAVEEAPAPVVENATDAPATGNTATASIVAVMAVAGVAAIVAKKRK